jgi:putative ABC transport system substrate-binding protein
MRVFFIVVTFLVLSAPWCRAGGVFAVFSADIAPYRQAFNAFNEVLHEKKGPLRTVEYILGKEEGERIAQQVATEKPLLVLVVGPEASRFAEEQIRGIPVVLSMVLHPQSFAGPNVTWVSLEIPARIKLEGIRKILPAAKRIGLVYSAGSTALYREVAKEGEGVGFQVVGKEIESGKEFPEAFRDIARRIDLFLMLPDPKIYFPKSIEYLLNEALKSGVPVIGLAASYTRAGALCSFEADYPDVGRQAGELAIRIIDGEKPSMIPPSVPRRVNTSLNLVVAERLGITIAPQVIQEARDVFK